MPQLQPNDFAPQLIWLSITFFLFYLAMSRAALPRIERVIRIRKTKVGEDVEKAREAQRSAEQEAARYDAEIAAAKAKAQASLRDHRAKLDAELADKRTAFEKDNAAKAARAEEAVRAYLERAATQIEAMTSDVVNDIVRGLAGVDVTEEEVRAALRQQLKE